MTNYDAMFTILCVIALFAIIYGPWQSLCTDYARQKLFEKRDELFNLAASGKLSFDSKVYKETRLQIERNIRFAHELTLPRFLLLSWLLNKNKRESSVSTLMHSIHNIPDHETRTLVLKLMKSTSSTMLYMMFAKSPIAMFLSLFIAMPLFYIFGEKQAINVKRKKAEQFIQIEANALPIKV